jgi:hypothetical protein
MKEEELKKRKKEEEKETLYSGLTKVGINTVSDLSNFLHCGDKSEEGQRATEEEVNVTHLVRLLGLQENGENKCMLTKICRRGDELRKKETSMATVAIEKDYRMMSPSN